MGGLSIDEIEDVSNDKIQIEGPDNTVAEVVTRAGDSKKALAVDAAVTVSDVKIKGNTDDTLIGNEGDRLKTQLDHTRIEGATDSTEIGNVGDRMKTDSELNGASDDTKIGNVADALKVHIASIVSGGITVDPVPPKKMYWQMQSLLNGSSDDMNVDGSSTSVVFEYAPPSGTEVYLDHISLAIRDNGVLNPDTFGAETSLTNGVLLQFTIDSTDYTIINLQENWQIATHFSTGGNMVGESNGFLNDKNIFTGNIQLTAKDITLNGTDGDKIKVTVRDDLTGLTFLRMAVGLWVDLT